MINAELIEKNFEKIGTSVNIKPGNAWQFSQTKVPLTVNVVKEKFVINYNSKANFDLSVLDIDPKDRHLLLMIKVPVKNANGTTIKQDKIKLLCGHDEKHYFSCGVPERGVTRIVDAKKALMPASIKEEHARKGRTKNLLKRKNEVMKRQGEWFFVKRPNFIPVDKSLIRRNEPISRGGRSKPHICEELYNIGGESVYVNATHAPNGVNEGEFQSLRNKLLKTTSWDQLRKINFEKRTRNARVYVRGHIRHPDHSTIRLEGWYEVLMNTENQSKGSTVSVFLD
jgi:hypothetical protein